MLVYIFHFPGLLLLQKYWWAQQHCHCIEIPRGMVLSNCRSLRTELHAHLVTDWGAVLVSLPPTPPENVRAWGVCCCRGSVLSSSLRPHGLQHARLLSSTLSWSLLRSVSMASVMLSNHLILCCLLLLPSVFLSISVFSSESTLLIRWPKYWSFSISPSNEYSELISFSVSWFEMFALQGTLKSLLQHHDSKTSVVPSSASFMVQLSHRNMTTGKKP